MTESTAPSVRTERSGHVLLLTLDRPQARNAIDADVANRVADALDEADADRDVRCIVVTGAGDKAFCAGADLKGIGRGEVPIPTGREHYGFAGLVRHPTSKPLLAAVNGFALGGGAEIVLASDLAVAAEHATFGLPEVKRGLLAAAGGVFRLPEQLPRKVAMQLILTGEPMSAEEALRWGLVNQVVPADELLKAAMDLAERIAANAPLAIQASKRIARGQVDGAVPSEEAAWTMNDAEMAALVKSNDTMEGVIAFAEKRAPVWTAT